MPPDGFQEGGVQKAKAKEGQRQEAPKEKGDALEGKRWTLW